MHWDFRVIRTTLLGRDFYQLHRVIYADDKKILPVMIETSPFSVVGFDPKVLLSDIDQVCEAFEKPSIYLGDWDGV